MPAPPARRRSSLLGLLGLALVEGLGGCSDPGPSEPPVDAAASPDAPAPGTPDRPPRSPGVEMEAWLDQGHFRNLPWRCEPGVSPVRLNGSHQRHRICSNQALLESDGGSYPSGAASVKELYTFDDQPRGFAVGLKIAEGLGAQTWYWYEATRTAAGTTVIAAGVGVPDCAVCHGAAPRDHVFFQAR